MNAVVFEHVQISDLPAAWRARLSQAPFAQLTQVTVRIEEEAATAHDTAVTEDATANPLFGMWRDREDLTDVAAHVHQLRSPRPSGNHSAVGHGLRHGNGAD